MASEENVIRGVGIGRDRYQSKASEENVIRGVWQRKRTSSGVWHRKRTSSEYGIGREHHQSMTSEENVIREECAYKMAHETIPTLYIM